MNFILLKYMNSVYLFIIFFTTSIKIFKHHSNPVDWCKFKGQGKIFQEFFIYIQIKY